jgi:hypothetical protein
MIVWTKKLHGLKLALKARLQGALLNVEVRGIEFFSRGFKKWQQD